MPQQLYAKIKRTSKYYGQTEKGERFPVHVEAEGMHDYRVRGENNDYRLVDVNLFIVGTDGTELKIS